MNGRAFPLLRLYRAVWWSLTLPSAAFGVGSAFLVLGPAYALVFLAVGAGFTALAAWQLTEPEAPGKLRPALPPLALRGGVAVLAVIGLLREWGAAGLGLSLLLSAMGADALRRERAARNRPDPEARGPVEPRDSPDIELIHVDPLPPLTSVGLLSTEQLCWAWRLSYLPLRRPDTPVQRLTYLAQLRSRCLDELEQRYPVMFRQWLPTARAAGDPARFFCPRTHD